mmetsp:Transcript_45471/g.137847  ORF Transcript_45471/g.137847 Transcript_45471/m.137847 type:complete len:224 (+) Transcript_45471:63-734(+)
MRPINMTPTQSVPCKRRRALKFDAHSRDIALLVDIGPAVILCFPAGLLLYEQAVRPGSRRSGAEAEAEAPALFANRLASILFTLSSDACTFGPSCPCRPLWSSLTHLTFPAWSRFPSRYRTLSNCKSVFCNTLMSYSGGQPVSQRMSLNFAENAFVPSARACSSVFAAPTIAAGKPLIPIYRAWMKSKLSTLMFSKFRGSHPNCTTGSLKAFQNVKFRATTLL